MKTVRWAFMIGVAGLFACAYGAQAAAAAMDLSKAVVVAPESDPVVQTAARMLVEEITKRTGIEVTRVDAESVVTLSLRTDACVVTLGTIDGLGDVPASVQVPEQSEGYAIEADGASGSVYLVGRDARGALYAAGRLLRLLDMEKGKLTLDAPVALSTAPEYRLRGHEIGYRNKSNTYDAWSVAQYEQYIRDLAVFGNNLVQLIYEFDHSQQEGPHMTEPVFERCVKLAKVCEAYGQDVWIWMPVSEDLTDPEEAAAALEARRPFFEQMSPLTAVFVPRGSQKSAALLEWMPRLAALVREYHPDAQIWLSSENESNVPSQAWNETLFDYLAKEQPTWLTGAVFDTWQEFTLKAQRERVPEQYPISRYADITHSIECQYPVPEWDRAFGMTLGREGINPRPEGMAHIFRKLSHYSVGFNTYSDGAHDDVNKILWNALGWDSTTEVRDILRDYAHYFIGEGHEDAIAEGLFALERNWRGPLLENDGVEDTLAHWRQIEKKASKEVLGNWRFQMGLYRAYYDACVQRRLVRETKLEEKAYGYLERAAEIGSIKAVGKARAALAEIDLCPTAPKLRKRIGELGLDLFESIGMQLSVRPPWGALNWERGATLGAVDHPQNDRVWLELQLAEVMSAQDEIGRLALIDAIVNWENPGPGGFYDDLGCVGKQPHLVYQHTFEEDPGFVESPQNEHITTLVHSTLVPDERVRRPWRLSWMDQAQTLYYTPLRMRYDGLDPNAAYAVQVVYTGRFRPQMKLTADDAYVIHDFMAQPNPPQRLEFDVPKEATQDGVLELAWERKTGRGPQVSEIWLVVRD